MISLATLLASATVAAAAKKVEDAPAPGIVDTVLLALARGGADKAAAEAIAWTLGTALGLKYVAARA